MNIEKLKLFKQGLEDNFDRIQNHFNMLFYRSEKSSDGRYLDNVEFISKNDCGSHGCLLGWAPTLDIEELDPAVRDFKYGTLDFEGYCDRVFNIKDMSTFWRYLFSATWADYDNTLQGAIARLEKVISGEVTEENAEEFLPWVDYTS